MIVIALALPASAIAQTVAVTIKGMKFTPADVTVHVGDTVEWINGDFVAHTTTARSGDWDVKIAPSATGRVVVEKAGHFAYYCRFHPNMTGTVTAN